MIPFWTTFDECLYYYQYRNRSDENIMWKMINQASDVNSRRVFASVCNPSNLDVWEPRAKKLNINNMPFDMSNIILIWVLLFSYTLFATKTMLNLVVVSPPELSPSVMMAPWKFDQI